MWRECAAWLGLALCKELLLAAAAAKVVIDSADIRAVLRGSNIYRHVADRVDRGCGVVGSVFIVLSAHWGVLSIYVGCAVKAFFAGTIAEVVFNAIKIARVFCVGSVDSHGAYRINGNSGHCLQ